MQERNIMKKLQEGFSAVEGLLIVIIVGMLGGVGWYVWHSQKQVDKTYSQTANSSAVPNSKKKTRATDSNAGYFVIKEWGVRAKYSGNLTLGYKIGSLSQPQPALANISSNQLDISDPACKVDLSKTVGYGGSIVRYKSTDHYLMGDFNIDSGKTAAQYASTLKKADYSHVEDYYFFYFGPTGVCSQSQNVKNLMEQTTAAVKAILPSLEATPTQ
jgi:hypothetical protein